MPVEDQSANTTRQELLDKNNELAFENQRLKEQLANLQRLVFGQKTERFVPVQDSDQLSFIIIQAGSFKQSEIKTEHISYTRKKQHKKRKPASRQPLPAHLPRYDMIIEPDQDTTGMKKIGDEITAELEYEPPKY